MIRHGSVWDMLNRVPISPPVPTGSTRLDQIMNGGLYSSVAYEVNGVEMTGKTTWCLERCAEVVQQELCVIFLTCNNTPVREIVGPDIPILEGLSENIAEDESSIIIEHIFSPENLLAILRNIVHINTEFSEKDTSKRFFVVIDAITPLIMASESDNFSAQLRDIIFQIKAHGNWLLAISNGERVEMDYDCQNLLDGICDAGLTFTWHDAQYIEVNRGGRKNGPSVRLTRARQGLGIVQRGDVIPLEWKKMPEIRFETDE
mmetsp:Transcript_10803/g.16288  ORF Transcript_10803/g.16288 Transcript_10803/m.16288 type:complete len:260 (-) Transcript_10803:12-791(-)